MNYRPIGTILLAVICAAGAANAQERQRDTAAAFDPIGRSSGPGAGLSTDPNSRAYAPGSPGDSDLGDQLLLLPVQEYQPLTLFGGVDGRWVSNAALTDTGVFDDFYWHYGAGGTYLPHLTRNLYAEVAAEYEWYRYSDHSELDFDSLDARVGLVNVFRDAGDLSVWARYNYSRLAEADGDELFTGHSIEIGAFQPLPLRRDHFFYVGWLSDFSLDANPGYAERDEHSVLAGYRYTPIDKLELGLFYRFSVYDYETGGRTDLNHFAGASADYHLSDHVSLRAAVTYQLNDSDTARADYESLEAGGTVGLRIKF